MMVYRWIERMIIVDNESLSEKKGRWTAFSTNLPSIILPPKGNPVKALNLLRLNDMRKISFAVNRVAILSGNEKSPPRFGGGLHRFKS
jgi:hypothetical protein